MELKLWEKNSDAAAEKLIASTRVPLHQFYIAFKDIEMMEYLDKNKLPIISIDSFTNFVTPLSNELYCQVKILLAIGNEHQIDFLKLSRNLHNLQPLQRQVNLERQNLNSATTSSFDANAQIKNKLSAFIDSLSQKHNLPDAISAPLLNLEKLPLSSSSSIISPVSNVQSQIRSTADLLDTLQRALSQTPSPIPPPSTTNLDPFSVIQDRPEAQSLFDSSSVSNSHLNDCIKMLVSIEYASNLPKIVVKKNRNKRKSKGTPPTQRLEYEPHTYATFEAEADEINEKMSTIKSHEGTVFCTRVVKGCNPEYNQDFIAFISLDVLKNPHKKFVVKIWRKASHEPTKMEATPFEDCVVGFSAIDVSILLTGLPCLSGFYNIIDFSGRCNGQLKISLKPFDDISKFKSSWSPDVPLMRALNVDVCNSESSNDGTLLSRTLKRKFTELDEITERLRVRLLDVTGETNDPDEEFERDLNTAVDDMDDDDQHFNKEDFAWLKEDDHADIFTNSTRNLQAEMNKILQSQPSTSTQSLPPQRLSSSAGTNRETGTGCSSSSHDGNASKQFVIDELLKKYDLDTIINPQIFKNILDPNIANSDSTPTLNPRVVNREMNNSSESDTTVSSISNDHVQTIQKALQKTSLRDNPSPSREDPDGFNNN